MRRAVPLMVTALVLLLAAAVAVGAAPSATTVVDLPSHVVTIAAYGPNVCRIRFVHKRVADPYSVTDVVVRGPDEATTAVDATCNPEKTSCTAVLLSTLQKVTFDFDAANAKVSFLDTDGRVLIASDIPLGGSIPEGTFRFPLAEKLYGIPEHAVDLALKPGTTYRLMNLDVFQYKLDDPGGIYGTIPFLLAHGAATRRSVGMLWLNSADTRVGVGLMDGGGTAYPEAKWTGEGDGVIDFFLFAGGSPRDVMTQHSRVTGPTMLPPQFSLGYHQCRWNYRSTTDCLEVDAGFDNHNIPYDVLWLDIEHTDSKKYFTWDSYNFPDPKALIQKIASHGRKMVTITDPHIKRENGYHVHDEATRLGYYVKTESGSDFEGDCWPGRSSWVDFYNQKAREWYATLFKYDRYTHSTPDLYTWIDMNEPSVFNAHEVTMDKNAVHRTAEGKEVRHRDLHNMFGYYHTMAAHQGHLVRNEPNPTRPFILTRSFFSGSQRYAAMWTGDNAADWGHLQKSIPMLLTLSLSNYAFVGADVGGFFGNPEPELLIRWYQAAAYTPFFRGHAHLETKRREPWLFGEENTQRIRSAIVARYQLMPYIYTSFFRAHQEGTSLMRPLFFDFPDQASLLEEQVAYLFGPSLLVRPIVEKGATTVLVPLPGGDPWYAFPQGGSFRGSVEFQRVTLDTPAPVFLKGGHIVPTRQRLRRSTQLMKNDPLTLYVALNDEGKAKGEVYLDDGLSFDYRQGRYLLKEITFAGNRLSCSSDSTDEFPRQDEAAFRTSVEVERIIIFGMSRTPTKATLSETVNWTLSAAGSALRTEVELPIAREGSHFVIRRPGAHIDANWAITLHY